MTGRNTHARPIAGPFLAILLAFPVALYPSALLSDIAYYNTAVIQWSNFSSWLIAGADLFAGLVLAFAIIGLFVGRRATRHGRGLLFLLIVAVMFVLGFVNALQHARDGWHSVGTTGIVLSALCSVLALAAGYLAFSPVREKELSV